MGGLYNPLMGIRLKCCKKRLMPKHPISHPNYCKNSDKRTPLARTSEIHGKAMGENEVLKTKRVKIESDHPFHVRKQLNTFLSLITLNKKQY